MLSLKSSTFLPFNFSCPALIKNLTSLNVFANFKISLIAIKTGTEFSGSLADLTTYFVPFLVIGIFPVICCLVRCILLLCLQFLCFRFLFLNFCFHLLHFNFILNLCSTLSIQCGDSFLIFQSQSHYHQIAWVEWNIYLASISLASLNIFQKYFSSLQINCSNFSFLLLEVSSHNKHFISLSYGNASLAILCSQIF